jgi:hypothetical protein
MASTVSVEGPERAMNALALSHTNDAATSVAVSDPTSHTLAPTTNELGPALTLLLSRPMTSQVTIRTDRSGAACAAGDPSASRSVGTRPRRARRCRARRPARSGPAAQAPVRSGPRAGEGLIGTPSGRRGPRCIPKERGLSRDPIRPGPSGVRRWAVRPTASGPREAVPARWPTPPRFPAAPAAPRTHPPARRSGPDSGTCDGRLQT